MINYIWSFLILIGLVVGSINGKIVSISDSILSSSKEAVELCILMFGVVGLWSGLMNVAVSLGITRRLQSMLDPFLSFLFPNLRSTKAREYISTNITANMCSFLILNISSLQLIPVNIIAYRSQYGSVHPADIILPGIIATCCSTLTAIIFIKWKDQKT